VNISIRLAEERDVPELTRLIELSVRGLQAGDYSPAQLERALAVVYGVDTRLIADGTYFVAVRRGSKAMDDRVIGSSGDRVVSASFCIAIPGAARDLGFALKACGSSRAVSCVKVCWANTV